MSRVASDSLATLDIIYAYAYMHILLYLSQFLMEWEIFQADVVDKIKTHILCSMSFLPKSFRLWGNVKNICRAGQATDDNTTHLHCMLDM